MPNVSSSYFKGQLWYAIKDTNNNVTSNINITNWNLSLTCSSTDVVTTGGNTWGYISYADGTSATILSTIKGAVCDYYTGQIVTQNNTATMTTNWKYEPNITGIGLQYYRTANDLVTCSVDSNGNFTCPIVQDTRTIKGFRFLYTLEKSSSANIKYGLTSGILQFCESDTQAIINNNNTNTQTIHNDNQQQYNFITNTNIDTTTTNNVNNIDTSNSDTKLAVTNFALIPLNFMQSIVNSFNSSCSQVCIGQCGGSSGGGHDNAWRFIFPCLDIENLVGSTIYTIIDSLFAFGMIFAFIRSVRNFFINALLLTTDASSEVGVFL